MIIITVRDAQASAIIYSSIEMARANSLNVYYYISYLLRELPKLIDKDGNIEQIRARATHAVVKTTPG